MGLSFILIIGGLAGNVHPLMILPALMIALYHSIYSIIINKLNESRNSYLLKNKILYFVATAFLAVSVLILIGNFQYIDVFGVIQPFVYSILMFNFYAINKKFK